MSSTTPLFPACCPCPTPFTHFALIEGSFFRGCYCMLLIIYFDKKQSAGHWRDCVCVGQEKKYDSVTVAFWVHSRLRAKLEVTCTICWWGFAFMDGIKCTLYVCACVGMCVKSWSAWFSQCNGTALMDPHLSWSVQSVAEVQPSLTSSPAWKPYNLLSTILVLHFTHSFLHLSISVSINLIFPPFFIDLHQPPLSPECLPIKSFYPGSEKGETRISILAGWPWTSLLPHCAVKRVK